jgi:PcRGLX-like N-terminal RIFT barrel domain/PcRGLX-like protein central beta sandwich domain
MSRLLYPFAVSLLLASSSAFALEVKLTVSDIAGVARKGGTVRSGVPFAKGAVKDLKKLAVSAGGKKIPAQFRQLAKWSDGSVRWALLDCIVDVPAKGKLALVLTDGGGNPAPGKSVKVTDTGGQITISTGPLTAVIDRKNFNLFKSVKIDGKEVVTAAGKGLVVYAPGDKKTVTRTVRRRKITETVYGPGKPTPAGAPDLVKIEDPGPVRATVMLRGKFPGMHNGLLGYTARISAFAGQKFLKVRVWLENNGQHGYSSRKKREPVEWFVFDAMSVELGLAGAPSAECEGVKSSGKFKVFQTCKNATHYSKPAHGWTNFEYTITGGGAPKKGKRTDGVVTLSGGAKMTTAIRHFWENYDKAIEIDGQTLKMWLWPAEGIWPRNFSQHACPGYANGQIHPLRIKGLYNYPGSVHKSGEMIFDFSGRKGAESSAELSQPLFALASADYYASTEAAPGLFAPPETMTGDNECDQKLTAWTNMARSVADPESKSSIWHARTTQNKKGNAFMDGYWYGWMEFGDLSNPGSGYTSLHYDWPWVVSVNLMRTGDIKFLRLADEMVRHRVEVDQQWSDRALEHTRGFQRSGYGYRQFHTARFTGGHPSVAGTWLAGPVLYYMLTGDAKTKEAIDRTAKYIEPAWKRMETSKHYGTRVSLGNMQMAARSIFSYCSLYAIDGEKKWLDEALSLFNRRVMPKYKGAGPHMHARQQIRSQSYSRDDIKYCYSIQAFCLLQHYTGDKTVLKVLTAGCDKDFPENFFDAPLFLADLHAFVALKTGKSDYADDAVEHWIEASPESKLQPVFLPNNSKWTERKAMHLRAGHLLQYYFWKKGKK